MVRWYGGFDSYIVAQEFNCIEDVNTPIYSPSMGRKIQREDELEINHLPYMTWLQWQTELSKHKFAVHLMTTHAAGTFALNCAYHGIPCIGYRGLDTQEQLHPMLSVKYGNITHAKEKARRLIRDKKFYDRCSQKAKENYNEYYSEKIFGLVGDNFNNEDTIKKLPGNYAIGHNRYSTTGGKILRNVQPFFADTNAGGIGVSHNGNFTNAITLRNKLVQEGAIFYTTSDTETIVQLIAK